MLQSESVNRACYFWFHAGPVVCHYKFTRWYLSRTNAPLQKRDRVYNALHDRYCRRCLNIALHLKGLYVKIAQIVSSRPDFVPPQYVELFTTVQDSIPQSPVNEIVAILDRNLRSELGTTFDEVFESIEPVALGAASIGQVHQARLRQPESSFRTCDDVAVKVMRNGAENIFHHDFRVFRYLCKVALSGWEPILDECYRQIMNEFDYRKEAGSLQEVRDGLEKSRFRRQIKVPRPLRELCTKEILVMEMLNGKKLSDSLEEDLQKALTGSDMEAHAVIKRKRLGNIIVVARIMFEISLAHLFAY
jgi:aarF domain-containing kinase